MQIEKVACINLSRRKERLISWVSSLYTQKVPISLLARFGAKDAIDYGYTELVESVVQDNFPTFEYYLHPSIEKDKQAIKPILASTWSYLRAFRWIIEQNETILLMEDDTILTCNFSIVQNTLEELPLDAKLVILSNNGLTLNLALPESTWVNGGKSVSSQANIYTPDGAAKVLADLQSHPGQTVESLIGNCYKDTEGVYSYIGNNPLIQESIYSGKSDVTTVHQQEYQIKTIF